MDHFKMTRKSLIRGLVPLAFGLLLAACGGGGGGDGGTGTIGVSLTDAPACGYDEVNVTVRQVRIHRNSAAPDGADGWAEITLSPARKINLLDLNNGVLENLGDVSVPAGQYSQVRLVLVANTGGNIANSVVLSGTGTEIPIATPSAVQSGIKLVHGFTVLVGQRVDLILDFDACKSIVTRGNGTYALKPVIKVIPALQNGIQGAVAQSLLPNQVVISAQQGGEIIRSTVPKSDGTFFLGRLETGSYDVVVTADSRVTSVFRSVPIANDVFIAVIGSTAQPINLAPATARTVSGTVALSPVPASETVAYVTARQTINGTSTITVRSTAADLADDTYSLLLPADAPLVGDFGTGTLPITLTPALSGGQYAIRASAEGYASQSVNRDVSAANQTADFTLVP